MKETLKKENFYDKKNKLLSQLKEIGIKNGDTLFVTADLMLANVLMRNRMESEKLWLEALADAVGAEGTIIAAAYTKSFSIFSKKSNIVFSKTTTCTSGALQTAMLRYTSSVRSSHPTNSIVGIGKYAEEICGSHTHISKSYDPIRKIIELNGKHLMIGTLDTKNAPLGFHFAQQEIGETSFSPGVGLRQVYYMDRDTNEKKLFTRWDIGGCSGGGYKTIGHHIVGGAISFGKIGEALSALIDAKLSEEICRALLIKDRRSLVCDDYNCVYCQGRWSVNGAKVIIFYIKILLMKRNWLYGKLFK